MVATGVRPGRPAPLRLTRRGRAVVLGLFIAMSIFASAVLWTTSSRADETSSGATKGSDRPGAAADARPVVSPRSKAYGVRTEPRRTIVVSRGETLWSIAARIDPTRDRRAVVAELTTLNGLTGTRVIDGQTLFVPEAG